MVRVTVECHVPLNRRCGEQKHETEDDDDNDDRDDNNDTENGNTFKIYYSNKKNFID